MGRSHQHIHPGEIQVRPDNTGEVTVFFESESLLFASFELEPGCSLSKDIHEGKDEGYWVAYGELTVELPEERVSEKVGPGEVFYIGSNTWHTARNEGTRPVKVIAAIG